MTTQARAPLTVPLQALSEVVARPGQRKSKATKLAEAQGEAQQAATDEQVGNFKKAFSVCLEAKDYLVKY